jgi:Mlc titration factor MtfA (ptsG expression regulator)
MNIIFGKEQFELMADKYTMLELDSFLIGSSAEPVTAYCAVENISIDQLAEISELKTKHAAMIEHYRARQWQTCQQLLSQLLGQWNEELDSFYQELDSRLTQFIQQDPGPDWSPIIVK